ncbi:hypothetical protein K7X08_026277 [Anisodus acutangulus]|uniref:RING-type E3 ubiquitin transferase n=1 Tax=Anisodus acutangulus TaxID=402998 RepID=A0A9Q1N2A3_9SOLA|nr:hypothetical protein K7X08_026277 [Anisodus acutangulus]
MSQRIELYDPECCLSLKLLRLNLSASPFNFTVDEPYITLVDYSIFKCSGLPADYQDVSQACASDKEIFAIYYSLDSLPPTTCKKIHDIPSVPYGIDSSYLSLSWSNPVRYCEGREKDCGFKNYAKQLSTQCFNRPFTTKGGVLGIVVLGIIMMTVYKFYSSRKIERQNQRLNQGEELKIRIEEDDDIIIARKLAIIGLWCIQWNATDRPSIKVVTQMLKGDGNNLTVPPPFTARNSTHVGTE